MPNSTYWAVASLLALPFFSTLGMAGEFKGYIGAEGRYFFEDAPFDTQEDPSASLSAELEYFHDFASNDQRLAFTAFTRYDSVDDNRTHTDLREAYWWRGFDQFEVYFGLRKIYWGVTESVHLVDIINQTDVVENIDGEDKLGQGMLQLVSQQTYGLIEFFLMPHFREQTFPSENARLRLPIAISDNTRYQSSDGDRHVDFALNWSHYFNVWDVNISHFSGTNRTPIFFPTMETGQLELQPYYSQIDQTGLALQATVDAWLWKLEAISVEEEDYGRNSAAVAGLEYTFFSVFQTNADLGLIGEYQFDDRVGARQTLSQNDLAIGMRWALNDIDGSEFLTIASHDFDYDTQFFSFELGRRITDDWRIEAEARFFAADNPLAPSYAFDQEDYVQLEIRRYF
ncbi:hypothetical protein [Teredinibacter franksiae]|jgi:hypothetical protein|uniref:hypothetical protein n=1 Tax=Teredinibacter franksiae TaxID=2761453 RepID=UPI001628D7FF|nr:hypothetical protein [Teredinibacter franksiae]